MGRSTKGSTLHAALTSDLARIGELLFAIVAISIVHYATNRSEAVWHALLLRLYYVPILIGAYRYGPFGGALVALACSVAYVPHLREEPFAFEAGRYAEIVVFHLIGITVGLLADAQRRVAERYRVAAATLERANAELRESYEQLQRADRLKTVGEIAAGLAHEIRHPLASIRGALEIIGARSQAASPEEEFSRLAMAEVQRLDHLVWEFLRYARPHEPDLRPTPLSDVVERSASLLRLECQQASVTLVVDHPDATPIVLIDPLQIQQVLLNVIFNAVQASPPGSYVRIIEAADERRALIDVVDEGPGIPTEHQAQVFSPFFTTREKGTGLGLAIAQRIVSSHRGHIEVLHTSPRGTCMRISLPLAAVAQRKTREAVQEPV